MKMRRLLSAQHPSEHSASTAEYQHGKKIPGNFVHSMIHYQGNNSQNQEIESSQQKPPKKFLAALPFPGEKSGQEGDDDVDTYNTSGNHLFRQVKAIEQKGHKQQKSGGQKIGQEQTL